MIMFCNECKKLSDTAGVLPVRPYACPSVPPLVRTLYLKTFV